MSDLGEEMAGYQVRTTLYAPDGKKLESRSAPVSLSSPMYGDTDQEYGSALDIFAVKNPAQWSAESPSLYPLTLTLVAPGGEQIDFESTRVGFRQIEIEDRQVAGEPSR